MKKLFKLRKSNGWTCQYMADNLGCSKTFYWQIENGNRRLSYLTAYRIAKLFKLKPDDIFYEEIKKQG